MFGFAKLSKHSIVVVGGLFLLVPNIKAASPVPKPICEPPVLISETLNFKVQNITLGGWQLALYLSDEKEWVAGATSSKTFSKNKKNEIVLKFEEGRIFRINMSDIRSDGRCYFFLSTNKPLS